MSNQDSFINEVTEEVRRDRLYALFRKYGWIAALLIVLIVGGAAVNEWRKAASAAEAEAAGDALIAALQAGSPEARAEALSAVEMPEDAGRRAITQLMQAGAEAEAGNVEAARETLRQVASDASIGAQLRDLATLKLAILSTGEMPPEERMALLSPVATPGNPYRLLALEQIALAEIEAGNRAEALDTLMGIAADAAVTQDLRRRVSQLIVALGGELAAG